MPRASGFDVLDQILLMKFFQISKFDRFNRSHLSIRGPGMIGLNT